MYYNVAENTKKGTKKPQLEGKRNAYRARAEQRTCICMDSPPGAMIYFEQLFICFDFDMTFLLWLFQTSGAKLAYFHQNTHILPKTSHLTPSGCLCMNSPPRAMVFFPRTINILQFTSKYNFCYGYCRFRGSNSYMYGLSPWQWHLFWRSLNMLQFWYDFCYDYSRFQRSN